jgi:polysaccharide biosynthesis protein VpsQ
MKFLNARNVTFVFIAFMLALVWAADSGRGQSLWTITQRIPAGDKVGHLILYGILTFLVNVTLRAGEIRVGRLRFLRGSFYVLALSVLEELSQLFLPNRSCDVGDLASDLVAILLGGWLARGLVRWRSGREASAKLVATTHQGSV